MPGLLGATVARLTPDQKVACSNHVGVKSFVKNISLYVDIKMRKNPKDMTPT